jgi:hypothetical protein
MSASLPFDLNKGYIDLAAGGEMLPHVVAWSLVYVVGVRRLPHGQ